MQWTQQIGRPRAAPARALCDALRLLVVVHRLGRSGGNDGDGNGTVAALSGEARAQWLDHLVGHPASLAYLLMTLHARDDLDAKRSAVAQTVRRLLARAPRRRQTVRRRSRRAVVDPRRVHRFEPVFRHLWDDALSHLVSRDLLAVDLADGEMEYRLREAGERLLADAVYPRHREADLQRWLCDVIADHELDRNVDDPGRCMQKTARHLAEIRKEIGVPPERDPARELFQVTFREDL